uniref:Uncharacterized protein n=1 Tax=Arundo donax TaxID=35708 RepID=A0A0A9AE31_ARUDO
MGAENEEGSEGKREGGKEAQSEAEGNS